MGFTVKVDFAEILNSYSPSRVRIFRNFVQHGLGEFMSDVKTAGAKEMIPGTTKFKKPSTPGRLTNRSGRLSKMLLDGDKTTIKWTARGSKKGDPAMNQLGAKTVTTKPATSKSFHGTIEQVSGGFKGRWVPFIRSGSPALWGVSEENQESKMKGNLKQRLHIRAMWEHGLKGKPPRLYLSRAYARLYTSFSGYLEPWLEAWAKGGGNVK